jgi:hypothetical protein
MRARRRGKVPAQPAVPLRARLDPWEADGRESPESCGDRSSGGLSRSGEVGTGTGGVTLVLMHLALSAIAVTACAVGMPVTETQSFRLTPTVADTNADPSRAPLGGGLVSHPTLLSENAPELLTASCLLDPAHVEIPNAGTRATVTRLTGQRTGLAVWSTDATRGALLQPRIRSGMDCRRRRNPVIKGIRTGVSAEDLIIPGSCAHYRARECEPRCDGQDFDALHGLPPWPPTEYVPDIDVPPDSVPV